ncbi:MAG: hypothetical protein LBG23_01210, partial [Endomicrobium sp.]|nr:hypothetical protein [Endomicrobium sp.]
MIEKYRVKLLLIFCLILNISGYSSIAQDIVIKDRVVDHEVIGNGILPDGASPAPVGVAPSNNNVTIVGTAGNGPIAGLDVAGGVSEVAMENVVSNRVDINIVADGGGAGTITGDVYGGWGDLDVINNKLKITGGNIGGAEGAYGGSSVKGKAEENILEIRGGAISADVYGGVGDLDVIKNKLKITGGNIGGALGAYGGYSVKGKAEENILEMEGGAISADVYGGWSALAVIKNKLKITAGNIKGKRGAYGGYSVTGKAEENILEMEGGAITHGDAIGGWGDLDVINNKVKITGGTIKGKRGASGGYSVKGKAEENILEMEGGAISANVYGGRGALDVINNKVKITGGNIK